MIIYTHQEMRELTQIKFITGVSLKIRVQMFSVLLPQVAISDVGSWTTYLLENSVQ